MITPKSLFRRTGCLPSNAHAYRLYFFNEPSKEPEDLIRIPLLAVISEALDCSTVFAALLKRFCVFFSPLYSKREKKTPGVSQAFWRKSLTMTYFHTGTRTIIGAKSFHCPVRDGKEWYQLAMVIRHKLFVRSISCHSLLNDFPLAPTNS